MKLNYIITELILQHNLTITSIPWFEAASRSRLISASILCLIASLQARWHTSVKSAPE